MLYYLWVCLLYHLRVCVQGIYSVFYFGVYYFMGMPSNTIYEFVFKKGILCLGMSPLILHHFNFQNTVRVIFFRTQYVYFILVYYVRVCLQYHLRVCLQDVYVYFIFENIIYGYVSHTNYGYVFKKVLYFGYVTGYWYIITQWYEIDSTQYNYRYEKLRVLNIFLGICILIIFINKYIPSLENYEYIPNNT